MFSLRARLKCALATHSTGLCVFLAAAGSAAAQTVQGVVTGTVTDASGAVIPNVELTTGQRWHPRRASMKRALTDGAYRFGLVPPGTYTLTAQGQGFTTTEIKNIIVDASTTVPVNVHLVGSYLHRHWSR